MKFLIDMPLSPALAQWLVGRGHEAVHASTIGMARSSDSDLIEFARREGRTLVTADLDYPRLLALAGSAEPSVILFRGGDWKEVDVTSRLDDVLTALEVTDIERSVLVIDRDRVRRRRLPIR